MNFPGLARNFNLTVDITASQFNPRAHFYCAHCRPWSAKSLSKSGGVVRRVVRRFDNNETSEAVVNAQTGRTTVRHTERLSLSKTTIRSSINWEAATSLHATLEEISLEW